MKPEEKIIKIVSETLGVEPSQLTPKTHFEKDLNVSKLEMSDLLLTLEKEFNTEITKEEKEKLSTVQDLINVFLDNLV